MAIDYRMATAANIAAMKALLFAHGKNQWNFIPEPYVDAELGLLNGNDAMAVLARDEGEIIGFAISLLEDACPNFLEKYSALAGLMFVGDVVVHADYHGKGVGSELLKRSLETARDSGITKIYISRHEENLASAGMMRKAGFVETETYHDPLKRTSGSCNTTVMEYLIS